MATILFRLLFLALFFSPAALAETGTPPEDTGSKEEMDTGEDPIDPRDTGYSFGPGFSAADLAGEEGGSSCTEGALGLILLPALLLLGGTRRRK